MLDRRCFLFSSAAVAAVAGLPFSLAQAQAAAQSENNPLPPKDLYDRDQEAYWAELRKQFLIPADEVYLNNGTVGSSPRPILRAILESFHETEQMAQKDPED